MHMFMDNVDFIVYFPFYNYWIWPLIFNLSKHSRWPSYGIHGHFFCTFVFLEFELF